MYKGYTYNVTQCNKQTARGISSNPTKPVFRNLPTILSFRQVLVMTSKIKNSIKGLESMLSSMCYPVENKEDEDDILRQSLSNLLSPNASAQSKRGLFSLGVPTALANNLSSSKIHDQLR